MYDIYTIQEGDTLESISNKFNTKPQILYELNKDFEPFENLVAGNKIIVPVPKPQLFNYYTIKKGDTLYNIARPYEISPEKLAQINGLNIDDYIYEGQVLVVPKNDVNFLVTKEGDTLEKITKDLGSPAIELLLQNPNIYLLPDQLITYKKVSNN